MFRKIYRINYRVAALKDRKLHYINITRMTTFIKTKFNILDDQTNIDKYRLAANITECHIISKLILQRIRTDGNENTVIEAFL